MIAGAPEQARWARPEPRRTLAPALVERLVQAAVPRARVRSIRPLTDGLRNANFCLQLDHAPSPLVLRMYEHDASLCQKEIDLMRLVGRAVRVPEIVYARPHASEDAAPFILTRYIEGVTFRELARSGDGDATAQAAYSAGATLAALSQFTFDKPGWLGPGLCVLAPLLEGANPIPRFIDLCLASENLQRRMPADLRERAAALVWSAAPELATLDREARLVHGDFGKRNLLVRNDGARCSIAGVLDWEFAVSGSPLADLGHFLRYERSSRPLAEPHFSNGFLHGGGQLPQEWRQLARVVDLTGLCESLTHDYLPDDVTRELVELIRATVEHREPQLI
jgi:aminoglycoside phosphotransferase (APT) family kinase protein